MAHSSHLQLNKYWLCVHLFLVYFYGLPVATEMRHLIHQVLEVFSDYLQADSLFESFDLSRSGLLVLAVELCCRQTFCLQYLDIKTLFGFTGRKTGKCFCVLHYGGHLSVKCVYSRLWHLFLWISGESCFSFAFSCSLPAKQFLF